MSRDFAGFSGFEWPGGAFLGALFIVTSKALGPMIGGIISLGIGIGFLGLLGVLPFWVIIVAFATCAILIARHFSGGNPE